MENTNLCSYGCGQEAKYKFKNGRWCCSEKFQKCPSYRKLVSKQVSGCNNPMYNKHHTNKSKKLISESNRDPSIETRIKMSISQKKENRVDGNMGNWKGGYDSKGIPIFETYNNQISFSDKTRRNKKDNKILEVRCSYCGKWYIPTIISIQERVRSLNRCSSSECRLYCSDKCKKECPIYRKVKYPKDFKPATSREVQPELRQMRFEIDNYTCQKCGKHQDELESGLHCHHIEGIRWEPLESADIDKVITLCKNCHKKIHINIEGCKYDEMKCKGNNK